MIKPKATFQPISKAILAILALCGSLLFGLAAQADPMTPGYAAFERGHYATAARSWKKLADQGNPDAENALAILYQEGLGVAKDPIEAIRLLESASGHGLLIAKHNLGMTYLEGKGVDIDTDRAMAYFGHAAAEGLADSLYALGVAYLTGEGQRKDPAEARHFFKKAAQKDYPEAQLMIAHLMQTDQGGEPNLIQAFVWGSIAVENGLEQGLEVTEYASVAMSLQESAEAKRLLKLCQEYLPTCAD